MALRLPIDEYLWTILSLDWGRGAVGMTDGFVVPVQKTTRVWYYGKNGLKENQFSGILMGGKPLTSCYCGFIKWNWATVTFCIRFFSMGMVRWK